MILNSDGEDLTSRLEHMGKEFDAGERLEWP
jgi:hypothetical protein